MPKTILLIRLSLLVSALLLTAWARPGAPATPTLLSASVAGEALVAGDSVTWLDRRAGGSVWSYDRSAGTRQLAAGLGPSAAQLAGDGRAVAWLDGGALPRIQVLDRVTGALREIGLPADAAIVALAVDGGRLVWWDHAPARRGIWAYDLASGLRRRLAQTEAGVLSGRLVASDGGLLWSTYGPAGAALWHLPAGAAVPPHLVVRGAAALGALSGFGMAAGTVVYAFERQAQLWSVDLTTGARRLISGGVDQPSMSASSVAWADAFRVGGAGRVHTLDLDTGRRSVAVVVRNGFPTVAGLLGGALVVTVDRRPASERELWLAPPGRVHQLERSAGVFRQPEQRSVADGQIAVDGRRFVVAGAAQQDWTFNGVHLILPSRGINGSSFSAPVLDDAHAAAERAVWLDRARQIGARTIRIYVDMPGDTAVAPPPRPDQLYRLAADELAPRDMRLGLVIHNSGRFDDPDGAKMAWLHALLDCFGGGTTGATCRRPGEAAIDRTPLLGYISADNEINIHRHPLDAAIPGNAHCRPDDPALPVIAEDCFDHPDPAKRAAYVREALGWVALVRDTLRAHPTGRAVLLTVGMSIDLDHDILGDGQSSALNYFTRAPLGPNAVPTSLADLVDFLAPHSYTALPYREIVEPIERAAPLFAKPILLEEFGYPTDPILQPEPERPSEFKETTTNFHWGADGALALVANGVDLPPGEDIRKLCRYLPKLGTFGERPKRCQPSAPYVVQANLEAIFDLRYFAGGVAFMLADSTEKNDGSKRCYAADEQHQLSKNLFLGLFAIDERYPCGGTVNVGAGQIKNTGYRVCVAYRTGDTQRGNYADRVAECEIDVAQVPPDVPLPVRPVAEVTTAQSRRWLLVPLVAGAALALLLGRWRAAR